MDGQLSRKHILAETYEYDSPRPAVLEVQVRNNNNNNNVSVYMTDKTEQLYYLVCQHTRCLVVMELLSLSVGVSHFSYGVASLH